MKRASAGFIVVIDLLIFLLALTSFPRCNAAELPSIFKTSFSVGGQFYDYQNYNNVPYFHGGIDLCASAGTAVFTPVAGLVSVNDYKITATAEPHCFSYVRRAFKSGEVSSTRYLEVAITETSGRIWMFRHIDPASVPDQVFSCATNKLTLSKGSLIGQVGGWMQSVLPEKRLFDHIHLEIMAPDGNYLNPARLVKTGPDFIPPSLHKIYAVKHGSDQAVTLTPGIRNISGKIDLIIEINDRMNLADYQHSAYSASWSLEKMHSQSSKSEVIASEVIAPHEVFRFDKLPFTGERIQLSKIIYRDSLKTGNELVQANGNSGPRFFLVNLTSGTTTNGYSDTNCLDTTKYPDGLYRLKVLVEDSAANKSHQSAEFIILN